jgi:hypothetical protein
MMETDCLVVVALLVVWVVEPRSIETIVAACGAGLLVRVFEVATLRARGSELRVFNTLENVPR